MNPTMKQQSTSSSTRLLPLPRRRTMMRMTKLQQQPHPSSSSSSLLLVSSSSSSKSSSTFTCTRALIRAALLSIIFCILLSDHETSIRFGKYHRTTTTINQFLTIPNAHNAGGSSNIHRNTATYSTNQKNMDQDFNDDLNNNNDYDDYDDHDRYLQSLIQKSAFDTQLYHSFHPPYVHWECQPHKIHLAQRSNVDPISGRVNMTITFTLTKNYTGPTLTRNEEMIQKTNLVSSAPQDICNNVIATVTYGRGFLPLGQVGTVPKGFVNYFNIITNPNNTNSANSTNSTNNSSDVIEEQEEDEVVQFQNYTSPSTGEDYTSDYIHHIVLPNLLAGREKYWYRIHIQRRQPPPSPPRRGGGGGGSGKIPFSFPPTTSHMGDPTIQVETQRSLYRSLRGSFMTVGETPVYEFRTPPSYNQPTSFALVGDLGQTINSTKTMNHIYQSLLMGAGSPRTGIWPSSSSSSSSSLWTAAGAATGADGIRPSVPVTALLLAGDLSYADGNPHRWESWLEVMEPLLRSLPLMSTPGNHEIECDNKTLQVFIPYESYFRNPNRIQLPDRIPPTEEYVQTLSRSQCTTPSAFLGHYNYGNAFYQFTHGLVHVIVLNSYTSSIVGSIQHQWLVGVAFPSVNRTLTPWLLVMFHCPLYTTFLGHNNEINPTLMLSNMEPLFVQFKVNLVLSGHDHAYLRTKPMFGGKPVPDGRSGPTYLTLGAGGNREHHSAGFVHPIPEEWVAKRDNDEYGYGHWYVANATHSRIRWVRDGTTNLGIHDDFWIENYYYV